MLAVKLDESREPTAEVVLQLERHLRAAESHLRLARTSYNDLLAALANQLQPSPCLATKTPPLSAHERRVALLVASGRNNAEVAAALCVSVHTVKSQLRTAYRKLGIHSRWQLVAPGPSHGPVAK